MNDRQTRGYSRRVGKFVESKQLQHAFFVYENDICSLEILDLPPLGSVPPSPFKVVIAFHLSIVLRFLLLSPHGRGHVTSHPITRWSSEIFIVEGSSGQSEVKETNRSLSPHHLPLLLSYDCPFVFLGSESQLSWIKYKSRT